MSVRNLTAHHEGDFPYQVSLQRVVLGLRYHSCGGSILSSNANLTAGHCAVYIVSMTTVTPHLTFFPRCLDQVTGLDLQVQDVKHKSVAPNDIAVFLLESSLSLGTYVQAISLPSAGSIPAGGSIAVLSGWGATETANTPDILQTVDVTVIDYETCSQNIDDLDLGSNPLTETMVCTGPIYDGISVCGKYSDIFNHSLMFDRVQGDSGGSLAQNGELIGVVSWECTHVITQALRPSTPEYPLTWTSSTKTGEESFHLYK
ncbi:trypsin-1-like [Schistocerca gregaria]|uniref:trypsin-1-like n=1 Tax=Schistocerca gregaria TaxID=7010 RepID=UPI00211E7156|nr:trypsin-1-like [Schistocerca gregaria]